MMIVAAVAGFAVAVQNVYTQRSQAPEVAAVLAAHAKPGDIVAYCPDQLGPALYRLLPAAPISRSPTSWHRPGPH